MTKASGTYRVLVDRSRGLVVVELSGFFFSVDGLAGYLSERTSAIARLGRAPDGHVILYDLSACPPQSGEVLDFLRHSIEHAALRPRRLAIVAGSALGRLQFERLADGPQARCFDVRKEALAWLST